MIQHTVYFYLKPETTPTEKTEFEAGLKELLQIPCLHKGELGVPATAIAERKVTDRSFGYALYTWFASVADHDTYQEHPIHKDFIQKYSGLWATVRVYDADLF